ncbi:hypothetical protein [Plantactinospora sonchi]|uniref:Lipoprotein n=1 Tax=Plantactinospora sonchi TaxID=1544735 RepID=A0ABU7RMW9_9ACTN
MIRPRAPFRRLTATVGAVAVLAFGLPGCGAGEQTPSVATANGAEAAGSPGPASEDLAAYVEDRRNLARCFREQGFDVPDPDSKGQLDLRAIGGRNKAEPEVAAAWKACEEFGRMPVPEELEERPAPLTPEQLAQRREYARCMRDNGMPDWPDPGPDGSWPAGGALGRELTEQEQAANMRALQICEPVLDGRPPTTPDPNAVVNG